MTKSEDTDAGDLVGVDMPAYFWPPFETSPTAAAIGTTMQMLADCIHRRSFGDPVGKPWSSEFCLTPKSGVKKWRSSLSSMIIVDSHASSHS